MLGLPRCAPAAVALLLAACGSDVSHDAHAAPAATKKHSMTHAPADSASADARSEEAPDAALASDAAVVDATASPPHATNVSFETAEKIEPGAFGVWPKRYDPIQADYYSFEARAGGFYVLMTEFNDFSPDNVIELYDPDQNPIAQNDDGSMWPGDEIDARLVVRTERAGTYFVRIANRETPPSSLFADNIPLPYYHFSLQGVDKDTPGFAIEDESNDTSPVVFADDSSTGYRVVTLLGELAPDDEDVFAFMGRTDQVLVGEISAAGAQGNGSTASFTRLQVANADARVLGRIDGTKGQRNIHPPVTDGSYQLTIDALGETGANPFYAIDLVMLPENPAAQADDQNDELARAEPLAMKGSLSRRGLLLTRLPPADIDYYSFDAGEGERLSLACESESGGSGVRGLHAEIRDDQDVVLGSADETPNTNLRIDHLQILASGNHYLRLSGATMPEADMVEPWLRCVLLVGP